MHETSGMAKLVDEVARALTARRWRMSTPESCTGGLIAAHCTDRAGSSEWFERGFVTYSNEAKHELLDVPEPLISSHGAVSEAVACAMAEGGLRHSHAQVCVAVTGIAGPGGAVPGKPVGTVWMAWAWSTGSGMEVGSRLLQLHGDRATIRKATVERALQQVLQVCIGP